MTYNVSIYWIISSLFQVQWVILCHQHNAQMCLYHQMGVTTGGGH